MSAEVLHGDCRGELTAYPADSFDAVVTDPPYGLVEPRSNGNGRGCAFAPCTEEAKALRRGGFMGKAWDAEVPGVDVWSEVLRVLKPGGYTLAMGGTRTYHRLACAVEDAGFEVRDCLMWMYGTGFPKGQGCLKPAWEPILLARKPGPRVLPLGIDACRVPGEVWSKTDGDSGAGFRDGKFCGVNGRGDVTHVEGDTREGSPLGRYPANVLHDGSDEVLEAFAAFGEKTSGSGKRRPKAWKSVNAYGFSRSETGASDYERDGDTGTAARFFYCAKASKSERGEGNTHPTVKPLALMRWMVRLVTPAGGRVLDPFAGSGSTLVAATLEGFDSVGVELDAKHCDIIRARLAEHRDTGLFAEASA